MNIPDCYEAYAQEERRQAEWDEYLASLPTCEKCGNAIQQESAVCLDGFWYCDKCLDRMRRWIDG